MLSQALLLSLLAASVFLATAGIIETDPIVRTNSGMLVGQKVKLETGNSIYRFLGVPYAQAPIGQNRFERPKWIINQTERIVLAQQPKPTCIQMRHISKTISPLLEVDQIHNISEDCLYLNIYVPESSQNGQLPVMVWLPGEGFDFADARQFNGAYLASMGNAVVITVQYRVGAFGFLKNNAGLWDQVMALQWIQDNVRNFGGDPKTVTVFGRFTGSMSISILLSSPVVINSEVPLFNRAILMSGIAVGKWVFDTKYEAKVNKAFENTGCTSIDCLKSLSADQLLDKAGYGWKPFFDSELITEEPLAAVREGKFPKYVTSVMLGTNRFEGSLCLLKHLVLDEPFYNRLVENRATQLEYEKAIREDLEMFYEDGHHSNHINGGVVLDRNDYVEFCSELLINSHMRHFESLLKRISEKREYNLKSVFKYKLDYKPSFSIAPKFINSSIHGDDVILAFGLAFKTFNPITENDQRVSKSMVSLFSNFAQFGYPVQSSEGHVEIKLMPASPVEFRLTTYQLTIVVYSILIVLFAIVLVILVAKYLKRESSVKQIKEVIQNYDQFH